MTVPAVELPSGDEMPAVGVGTRDVEGDTVREAVRAALEAGCTHVDTAEGYMNEDEIGDVLARARPRELRAVRLGARGGRSATPRRTGSRPAGLRYART